MKKEKKKKRCFAFLPSTKTERHPDLNIICCEFWDWRRLSLILQSRRRLSSQWKDRGLRIDGIWITGLGKYIVTSVQIERKLRAIFFAGRGKFESDCRRFSITIFLSLNHYISYKVFGLFPSPFQDRILSNSGGL